MPDPPDTDRVREATAVLQAIVEGSLGNWAHQEISLIGAAWISVKDLEQPIKWRLSWKFFGWRYALKQHIRQTGQQGRYFRLAEAIELDLQEHTIGESDLLYAISLMEKIPKKPPRRFRQSWTTQELHVMAGAIQLFTEHPGWLTHDLGLRLDAAVDALKELAALYVDRTDWQVAREVLDIDLREEAIIDRGHHPLSHHSHLDEDSDK